MTGLLKSLCVVGLLLAFQEKPAGPVPPKPALPHPDLVTRLGDFRWTHGEITGAVAFHPTAPIVASGGWGSINLWDAKTGRRIRSIKTDRWSIGTLRFSSDGKRLAGAPTDGKIAIWNVETGEIEKSVNLEGQEINRKQIFSPDLKRVLWGGQAGKIQLWDLEAEKSLLDIEGAGRILGLAISPDEKWIVSGTYTGKTADIWDATTGKKTGEIALDCHNCTHAEFSPDGKRLLLGAWAPKENLTLWEFEPRRKMHAFETAWVDAIAYSPDGKLIAAGDLKSLVQVWESESGKRLHAFTDVKGRMTGLEFGPDSRSLLATSGTGALSLWNLDTGALISDTDGHRGGVISIAVSPDQKSVWTGGADGRLVHWDLESGKILRRLQDPSASPLCIAFSPDRRTAIVGSQDVPLSVWDLAKGERTKEMGAPFCRTIGLSPDGRQVFARGKKMRDLSLWDVASGQETLIVRGFSYDAWATSMSPDGRFLACGTFQDQEGNDPGTITLWDSKTGERLWSMWGAKDKYSQIQVIAFSADSRLVMTSSFGSVSVFDVRDGKRIAEIAASPGAAIRCLALSPDGRLGLSGSYDKKVVLWDLATGKVEREFEGHSGPVTSVAFSPGGRHFISGSEDGSVLVWRPGREFIPKAAEWATTVKQSPEADRAVPVVEELKRLGGSFETACEARERLLALGEDSISAALKTYPPIHASGPADEKRLNEILRRLESDELEQRNLAAAELDHQDKSALPWIESKLAKGDSLSAEARRLLERTRSGLKNATFTMTDSGMVRAVMLLLEMTDSAKAREALERYARGPEWNYPSHVARRGLNR